MTFWVHKTEFPTDIQMRTFSTYVFKVVGSAHVRGVATSLYRAIEIAEDEYRDMEVWVVAGATGEIVFERNGVDE